MAADNTPLAVTLPPELVEQVAQRVAAILTDRSDTGTEPAPGYLDHEQAARYIAATPRRLYNLVSERSVPVYKDGSRNLYRRCDLDAYVEGRLEQ